MKKKRSKWAPISVETLVLEDGTIDTGNSGMNISIKEIKKVYEGDRHPSYQYRFIFRHGAMGYSTTLDIPLVHPDEIDYLCAALLRTKERMNSRPGYKPELRKDDWGQKDGIVRVDITDGVRMETVQEERVVDEYGTQYYIIGRQYFEGDTDKLLHEEVVFPPIVGRGGSGGSQPSYRKEDIGKLVKDVKSIPWKDEVKLDD